MNNNIDRFITDINEFSHNENFDKKTKVYEIGTTLKLKEIEDPVTIVGRNVYYKDVYYHYEGKKDNSDNENTSNNVVLFNDDSIEDVLKEATGVKKR